MNIIYKRCEDRGVAIFCNASFHNFESFLIVALIFEEKRNDVDVTCTEISFPEEGQEGCQNAFVEITDSSMKRKRGKRKKRYRSTIWCYKSVHTYYYYTTGLLRNRGCAERD